MTYVFELVFLYCNKYLRRSVCKEIRVEFTGSESQSSAGPVILGNEAQYSENHRGGKLLTSWLGNEREELLECHHSL